MNNLHTRYRLTVEVLTPLHIGTGSDLLRDYDYTVNGGRTWIIDQERLLEATLSDDGEFNNEWLSYAPAQFLQREDFRPDSPFFRYVLRGTPANRPLKEQIKDVWGQPYLPGSSVKGLFRTLLMWGLYTAEGEKPDLNAAGRRKEWAAQPLENQQLAPGSHSRRDVQNKDFLRALQVADSAPVKVSALQVDTTRIYPTSNSRGRGGIDIDIEAVRPGTVFESEITIDEYGFEDDRARQTLGWDGLRTVLGQLRLYGEAHARQRIVEEMRFHKEKGPSATYGYYRSKLGAMWQSLESNEWLSQLGWGTGWRSQTLNNLLTEQRGFVSQVVNRYNLGRGRYESAEDFPKTRNLALINGEPAAPMGWVKCRLEER